MSFSYPPGQTWLPHSTAEHAADLLNNINAVLKALNIVDSDGNLIQFAASTTNTVWIICLAFATKLADKDLALLVATQMFNVAQASDDQIQEDLPIAGTEAIAGAYSLVTITVTADNSGATTVPNGSSLPFGTICNFITQGGDITIPEGESADILCQADVIGPIAVGVGQITAFASTIAHVQSVTNAAAAIEGRNPESIQQARQRLQSGNISDLNLDGTRRAILSIQGIADCQMYINPSPTTGLVLQGGITVPVLSAYIVISGSDITGVSIAKAYAQRMLAQTYATSSYKQEYVTESGQNIDIKYDIASGFRTYVKLFYDPETITASGFDVEAENVVAAIPWKIGKPVTAAAILAHFIGADSDGNMVQIFPFALIVGAKVSSDGSTWRSEIQPDANKIPTIATADVAVEEESEDT